MLAINGTTTISRDTQARADMQQILWLLNIDKEKLNAFIIHTLADWLIMYYPDYEYHTWARSKSLVQWWYEEWFYHDRLYTVKPMPTTPPWERVEHYRMCHQYVFNGRDDEAQRLHAHFDTHWSEYVEEIKKAEAA